MSVEVRGVPTVPATTTVRRVLGAWASATGPARAAVVVGTAIGGAAPALALTRPVGVVLLAAAGFALLLAAVVDLAEHRLPNPLLGLTAGLAAGAAGVEGRLLPAIVAGTVAAALMLVVHLARGVGMGDVKASAALGVASLDLHTALVALAVASLVAAGTGFVRRRPQLPLGPSLWFGWAAALLLGVTS